MGISQRSAAWCCCTRLQGRGTTSDLRMHQQRAERKPSTHRVACPVSASGVHDASKIDRKLCWTPCATVDLTSFLGSLSAGTAARFRTCLICCFYRTLHSYSRANVTVLISVHSLYGHCQDCSSGGWRVSWMRWAGMGGDGPTPKKTKKNTG